MKTRGLGAVVALLLVSGAQAADAPRPQRAEPKTAADFLRRAQVPIRNEDWPAALAAVGRALALEPENLSALVTKGMVLTSSGKPREALEPLRRAVELRPDWPVAHLEYGRAIMATEDLSRWREALTQFDEALRLRPNYPNAFAIKASLLASKNDRTGVVATYRAWLRFSPRDPDIYASYAAVLERMGDKEGALDALDMALSGIDPNWRAFATRARLRLETGDVGGAAADVEAALRRDKNASLYVLRAKVRARQGQLDAALADLNAAVAEWPASLEALRERANLYERLNRFDMAVADVDRMLAIRPDYPPYLNHRCFTRAVGNIELEAALADCNASLSARPDNGDTLDSLGLLQLRRGDYAAAVAAYDAALAGNPKLADSLFGRGIAKVRLKAASDGEADMAAARKLSAGVEETFRSYGITP